MVWEKVTPNPLDPWQSQEPINTSGGIDMRAFAKKCLSEHGHNVFIRKTTDQRCACKQSQDDLIHPSPFDEFDPTCASCQGFGYTYQDVKVRAYRATAFGLTNDAERSELGMMGPGDTKWYVQYTTPVNIAHHIIEVTVDDTGTDIKAHNIERIHEIKFVHLYRDKTGRPEYFAVLAREVWWSK